MLQHQTRRLRLVRREEEEQQNQRLGRRFQDNFGIRMGMVFQRLQQEVIFFGEIIRILSRANILLTACRKKHSASGKLHETDVSVLPFKLCRDLATITSNTNKTKTIKMRRRTELCAAKEQRVPGFQQWEQHSEGGSFKKTDKPNVGNTSYYGGSIGNYVLVNSLEIGTLFACRERCLPGRQRRPAVRVVPRQQARHRRDHQPRPRSTLR